MSWLNLCSRDVMGQVEGVSVRVGSLSTSDCLRVTEGVLRDTQALKPRLTLDARASSARVNWQKSEAELVGECGEWSPGTEPVLPGRLQWGKSGLEVLMVCLGSETFHKQFKLSECKWLLPQLVASTLLWCPLQAWWKAYNSFWSGQPCISLWQRVRGQGLIDLPAADGSVAH